MATTESTSAFISLNDVINNFIISYTGPGKLIPDSKRTEVVFHARRCLQEFSYETLKSQFANSESLTAAASGSAPVYVPLQKDVVSITKVEAAPRVAGTLGSFVELTEVSPWSGSFTNQQPVYVHDYTENRLLLQSGWFPGDIKYTYLSNSLTNDEDAEIPKLAEEALYACMVYAILANRENTNPNLLQRLLIEKIDKLERSKSRLVFTNFSE
jgi:hypothetical protein